jgi:hypothetical protein
MNDFGNRSKSEATRIDARSTFLTFLKTVPVSFALNPLADLNGWIWDWNSTSSAYKLPMPAMTL